jgi:hypothetical protein
VAALAGGGAKDITQRWVGWGGVGWGGVGWGGVGWGEKAA